tara:strand:- start:158 stop:1081 length:924 start_codon:yes stop_codon:yes gene_type:complete
MKVIVFHQPFPMGNYKICTVIAKKIAEQGHEVYSLQQLNGVVPNDEYVQQIIDLNPDVVYSEMLDAETFKIVEKLNCKKILTYCSKGILPEWDSILDYKNTWYTDIMTNSKVMEKIFKDNNIPVNRFELLPNTIYKDEKIYTREYDHDCVFLGMGFNRLSSDDYKLERELFFSGIGDLDYKIYGNGWPQGTMFGGILPANDIGKLYTSSKTGLAIIAKGQRDHGMINNRYVEMAYCGLPIVTYKYDIDWLGFDKYLYFTDSKSKTLDLVMEIILNKDKYQNNLDEATHFINKKTDEFYDKLFYSIGK